MLFPLITPLDFRAQEGDKYAVLGEEGEGEAAAGGSRGGAKAVELQQVGGAALVAEAREAGGAGGGRATARSDFMRLVHEVTWRNRSTMVRFGPAWVFARAVTWGLLGSSFVVPAWVLPVRFRIGSTSKSPCFHRLVPA